MRPHYAPAPTSRRSDRPPRNSLVARFHPRGASVTNRAAAGTTRAHRERSRALSGAPAAHPSKRAGLETVFDSARPACAGNARDHAAGLTFAARGRRLDVLTNYVVVHGVSSWDTPFIGRLHPFAGDSAVRADAGGGATQRRRHRHPFSYARCGTFEIASW